MSESSERTEGKWKGGSCISVDSKPWITVERLEEIVQDEVRRFLPIKLGRLL